MSEKRKPFSNSKLSTNTKLTFLRPMIARLQRACPKVEVSPSAEELHDSGLYSFSSIKDGYEELNTFKSSKMPSFIK